MFPAPVEWILFNSTGASKRFFGESDLCALVFKLHDYLCGLYVCFWILLFQKGQNVGQLFDRQLEYGGFGPLWEPSSAPVVEQQYLLDGLVWGLLWVYRAILNLLYRHFW
mgnify:CR=1 FL=1